MFSWLGTIFILTVIFYAFYIPLKKLYCALSPKKRAIREAEEEWKMLDDIEGRKWEEQEELFEQGTQYCDQKMELDREDFDTEEAYQAEYERLELKYEEAMKEFEKAREEWKEAEKREQEAYERYDRKRRA